MKRKGLYIRVTEEQLLKFHRWCLDHSTTMSAELREHIDDATEPFDDGDWTRLDEDSVKMESQDDD